MQQSVGGPAELENLCPVLYTPEGYLDPEA